MSNELLSEGVTKCDDKLQFVTPSLVIRYSFTQESVTSLSNSMTNFFFFTKCDDVTPSLRIRKCV